MPHGPIQSLTNCCQTHIYKWATMMIKGHLQVRISNVLGQKLAVPLKMGPKIHVLGAKDGILVLQPQKMHIVT